MLRIQTVSGRIIVLDFDNGGFLEGRNGMELDDTKSWVFITAEDSHAHISGGGGDISLHSSSAIFFDRGLWPTFTPLTHWQRFRKAPVRYACGKLWFEILKLFGKEKEMPSSGNAAIGVRG